MNFELPSLISRSSPSALHKSLQKATTCDKEVIVNESRKLVMETSDVNDWKATPRRQPTEQADNGSTGPAGANRHDNENQLREGIIVLTDDEDEDNHRNYEEELPDQRTTSPMEGISDKFEIGITVGSVSPGLARDRMTYVHKPRIMVDCSEDWKLFSQPDDRELPNVNVSKVKEEHNRSKLDVEDASWQIGLRKQMERDGHLDAPTDDEGRFSKLNEPLLQEHVSTPVDEFSSYKNRPDARVCVSASTNACVKVESEFQFEQKSLNCTEDYSVDRYEKPGSTFKYGSRSQWNSVKHGGNHRKEKPVGDFYYESRSKQWNNCISEAIDDVSSWEVRRDGKDSTKEGPCQFENQQTDTYAETSVFSHEKIQLGMWLRNRRQVYTTEVVKKKKKNRLKMIHSLKQTK
ncbi:uncharacterized protein [Physcomitrium patens]|uniref:uncharacterized protein isoform X4 n=1 Tax=Physcomitrium patens TaxID=3218 RepID=UPI003CCE3952